MFFRITMWIIMIFGGIAGGYYLDSILFKGIHSNTLFHILAIGCQNDVTRAGEGFKCNDSSEHFHPIICC